MYVTAIWCGSVVIWFGVGQVLLRADWWEYIPTVLVLNILVELPTYAS